MTESDSFKCIGELEKQTNISSNTTFKSTSDLSCLESSQWFTIYLTGDIQQVIMYTAVKSCTSPIRAPLGGRYSVI